MTDACATPNNKCLEQTKNYLRFIKFEHSIFALPYAFIGMIWAGKGWPSAEIIFWIVVAMVSCRSAAMAYNRIIDRHIDAANPRTVNRELPSGKMSPKGAHLFFLSSCVLFFISSSMLNPLTKILSPIALGITLFYSLTKRFTFMSHFFLGLSLGVAPVAAWIATKAEIASPAIWLGTAVLFWTAGFDILYSLQDIEFDKEENLKSVPAKFGIKNSIIISRFCHSLTVCYLIAAGTSYQAGMLYFIGVAIVTAMLMYEHSLVKVNDLSKINVAFFTINGYISIILFLFTLMDMYFKV